MPRKEEEVRSVAYIHQLECRRVANGHDFGCATCTFWSCNLQNIEMGECHHDPPAAFMGANRGNQTQLISAWPTTKRDQWCGRHLFESAAKEAVALANADRGN